MINITFRIGRPLQAANVIVQVRHCCCFCMSCMDAAVIHRMPPLGCIGNAVLVCQFVFLPPGLQAYPWAPDMLAIINWWAAWQFVTDCSLSTCSPVFAPGCNAQTQASEPVFSLQPGRGGGRPFSWGAAVNGCASTHQLLVLIMPLQHKRGAAMP